MSNDAIEGYVRKRYPWFCEMLSNPDVSDIWINGPEEMYVETSNGVHKFQPPGMTEEALTDLAYAVAATSNLPVSVREPVLETTWYTKARIQAVLPPLSRNGTVFSIRKPRVEQVTLDQLTDTGFCTIEQAKWLKQAIRDRRTIMVSGSTGSGKTTLMQALLREIPSDERILILEDTPELKLPEQVQGVNLTSRPKSIDQRAIELSDLVKVALRMRPDRIIIGEVRGREVFGLIQSLNTGHAGGMSSIHANSAQDALLRLETLLMLTEGLTPSFARRLLMRTADVMVHLHRAPKGRRIAEITVVQQANEQNYDLRNWDAG
jgi:pilus assembly protein CpaF